MPTPASVTVARRIGLSLRRIGLRQIGLSQSSLPVTEPCGQEIRAVGGRGERRETAEEANDK